MPISKEKLGRGRPTTWDDSYIDGIYEYIEGWQVYDDAIPTVERAAKHIGCKLSSIYDQAKQNKELSEALGEIKLVQKLVLLNASLTGEFNSNIAKLIFSANHQLSEKTISESHHTSDGSMSQAPTMIYLQGVSAGQSLDDDEGEEIPLQ